MQQVTAPVSRVAQLPALSVLRSIPIHIAMSATLVNLLKPSDNFTYDQV
jgi:hypothetical protein